MSRRYDLLIFDWDGTLVDSADQIVAAMQGAIDDLGLPQKSHREMSRLIGLSLDDVFDRLFPELDPDELRRTMASYRRNFRGAPRTFGRAFPGVEQRLKALASAGYELAVATGKGRQGLDRALTEAGWHELFVATRTAEETAPKPDPRMLEELLLVRAVPSSRVLMVGDTTYDMEMARRAGVAAVGMSWGVHDAEELLEAGAHRVLDRLEDLDLMLD